MRRLLVCSLLGVALSGPTAPVCADRLHLESGGVIETGDWWIEGDKILYRASAGTVGIPRSMVLRVERGPTAAAPPERPTAPARQRSVAKEAERLERVRELLDDGMAALEKGDFETASGLFFHAMSLEPEAYAARVQYVFCEIQLGQDASALAAVLDGLVGHPDGAELHELLGDLKDRDEDMEQALRSWRRAFSLAPNDRLREKIEKGERDLHLRRNYEFARTSHFNLRYDGAVDAAIAAQVSEHLEQRFWELTNVYSHTPQQPITTLLYPNQAFREVTQAAEWVGGLYDGKIRVPLGGLRHLHRDAKRVLTHELTHAVVHSKSRGRCPRWLHEGLAQYSDGTPMNAVKQREVREQLAALGDAADWEDGEFSYPLAHSLTLWLAERRDFSHLVWVLESLGSGSSIDEALQRVYRHGYADLCRLWAADRVTGDAR
jgi:tetratricopeptide (TPR) repeat protein